MSPPPEKEARARVLGQIRRAVGATQSDADRRLAVSERIARHAEVLVPARAGQPHAALLKLFRTLLEGQSATVLEVGSADEIPAAVAGYLRGRNLPLQVRVGSDPWLAAVPWRSEPALELRPGRSEGSDPVGLSKAAVAAAESGTLVLAAGPENPTTLNFLPETHVVVVEEKDIVGSYEQAWTRLRQRYGERTMPRAVNFVSGPSRTADIEQQLIMGAHGPIRLCVIVVKGV